jgi:hypothetical protein
MKIIDSVHQELWGCKVEEKLYLEVREQKRLNIPGLGNSLVGFILHDVNNRDLEGRYGDLQLDVESEQCGS